MVIKFNNTIRTASVLPLIEGVPDQLAMLAGLYLSRP
jgi:hypothetical protein